MDSVNERLLGSNKLSKEYPDLDSAAGSRPWQRLRRLSCHTMESLMVRLEKQPLMNQSEIDTIFFY